MKMFYVMFYILSWASNEFFQLLENQQIIYSTATGYSCGQRQYGVKQKIKSQIKMSFEITPTLNQYIC